MGFLKCVIYIAILGVVSFLVGRILPASWFRTDRFPYKSYAWEKNGAIYNKLHIKKWQKRVPDMSKLFPKLIQPKKMQTNFKEELPVMIRETCIAELIHVLLCFAILYCLWLWPGAGGIIVCAVYILIGNVPFILIQRYNRPRLLALQKRLARQEAAAH